MTHNTSAAGTPKRMDNLSNCENVIKMLPAIADVNQKSHNVAMETVAHVGVFAESGDIFNCNRLDIASYRLPAQECSKGIPCPLKPVKPLKSATLTQNMKDQTLFIPYIADKSACVFMSKMLIQRDYCTGTPQAKVYLNTLKCVAVVLRSKCQSSLRHPIVLRTRSARVSRRR